MAAKKEDSSKEKKPSKAAAKKAKAAPKRPAAKAAASKGKKPKAKPKKAEAKKPKTAMEPAKKAAKKPEKKVKEPAKKAVKKKPVKKAPKRPAKKPAKKPPAKPKEEVAPAEKEEVAEERAEKPAKKKAPKKVARKEPELTPLLVFGRWDLTGIEIRDQGLARHMNLSPTFLPHTGGRWANRPFAKQRVNLVERLTNNMMRTEKYTGKKGKTIQVVKRAFGTIERRAKKNPVQVLVEALENAAPREEITRLRFGGISVPRAVDVAPARRLDLALRHLCRGAVTATYKNKKPIHACLADEIIMAAGGDINSYAIGKKEEMERVAASAR